MLVHSQSMISLVHCLLATQRCLSPRRQSQQGDSRGANISSSTHLLTPTVGKAFEDGSRRFRPFPSWEIQSGFWLAFPLESCVSRIKIVDLHTIWRAPSYRLFHPRPCSSPFLSGLPGVELDVLPVRGRRIFTESSQWGCSRNHGVASTRALGLLWTSQVNHYINRWLLAKLCPLRMHCTCLLALRCHSSSSPRPHIINESFHQQTPTHL